MPRSARGAASLDHLAQIAFGSLAICLGMYRVYSLPGAAAKFTNADELILPAFYDDIVRSLAYGTGWHFGAEHGYVPDFVAYALARAVTGNFREAIAVVGVLFPIAFFIIGRGIYREVGGRSGWLFTLLAVGSGLALVAYGTSRPSSFLEFYAYASALLCHFGTYLGALLGFLLYRRYSRTGQAAPLAGCAVITALLTVSDLWFAIYFTAPALALASFVALTARHRRIRQARFILANGAATAVSFPIYRWITPSADLYAAHHSLAASVVSAQTLAADLARAFQIDPIFVGLFILTPLAYLIVRLVALVGQVRVRQLLPPERAFRAGESDLDGRLSPVDVLLVYFAGSASATLVFLLAFGLYLDQGGIRYLHPLIYSPALFALISLGLTLEQRRIPRGRTVYRAAGSVAAAAAVLVALAQPGVPLAHLFRAPAYVTCFDRLSPAAGIAEYWDAKPLIMYSDHRLQVAGVAGNAGTYLWADNAYWYVGSWAHPGRVPQYDFILMDRLNAADVVTRYGEPDRKVPCAGTEIWLYHQPNDLYPRLVDGNPELVRDAAEVRQSTPWLVSFGQ